MPFCAQCGAQMEGRFCQSCGAANPAADAPPSGGFTQPIASGGLSDNTASALCYALGLITGLIFLLVSPYNRNPKVRFHAFQAIFFNVGWTILTFAVHAVGFVIFNPAVLLSVAMRMAGFGLWIYLMIRAYNGNPLVLPIIGPLAEQSARSR